MTLLADALGRPVEVAAEAETTAFGRRVLGDAIRGILEIG